MECKCHIASNVLVVQSKKFTFGSKKFPKKFCQVRWVENISTCERAIEVFDNVKKYVNSTKTLPSTSTCTNIKAASLDPFAVMKLSFFSFVAAQLKPFLKIYQTSDPMVSFLYDDLTNQLRTLLARFVK